MCLSALAVSYGSHSQAYTTARKSGAQVDEMAFLDPLRTKVLEETPAVNFSAPSQISLLSST